MKSNIWTMSIVLLVIASLSSSLLAVVYNLTKKPIEQANQKKTLDALSMVMPKFDNEPLKEIIKVPSVTGDSLNCYVGRLNGKVVGVAIESITDKAFSGKFKIIVGITPEGKIYNTIMLEHKETPGLGDKTEKSKSNWSEQFNDKDPQIFKLKVKKDGGDVDAITAATISSRAYCHAVDLAYQNFTTIVKPKLEI